MLLLCPHSQWWPPQLLPQQQKIRMRIRISQIQEQLLLLPVEKHIYVTSLAEFKTFYAAHRQFGHDLAKMSEDISARQKCPMPLYR